MLSRTVIVEYAGSEMYHVIMVLVCVKKTPDPLRKLQEPDLSVNVGDLTADYPAMQLK